MKESVSEEIGKWLEEKGLEVAWDLQGSTLSDSKITCFVRTVEELAIGQHGLQLSPNYSDIKQLELWCVVVRDLGVD